MKSCYDKYKKRIIWKLLEKCIKELSNNKDMTITTDRDYVIGYLAKKISDNFKIHRKKQP